ncbi:hypothetical protein FN846DRAFT_937650, partial [Sphaerosporella brunnea]
MPPVERCSKLDLLLALFGLFHLFLRRLFFLLIFFPSFRISVSSVLFLSFGLLNLLIAALSILQTVLAAFRFFFFFV